MDFIFVVLIKRFIQLATGHLVITFKKIISSLIILELSTLDRNFPQQRIFKIKMQSASDIISSLFWFKEENDVDDEQEQQILEQFVQNVEDFSSQYGSEISVSYTACNLRGPPSNFPDYGDYPQAFVMVLLNFILLSDNTKWP